MTSSNSNEPAESDVVVTGANGLVGSAVCRALVARGAAVRAIVRRSGTAPSIEGVEEHIGSFLDPAFAASVVEGASAVVTTVHPMGSPRDVQEQIAVEGTPVIARACRDVGVERLVHISTAAVYDRSPSAGDVDESSALVSDDAGDYPVTKRDTDEALAQVAGLTCVLLRPPAILGAGETSIWNSIQPATMRADEAARHTVPERSFAWVHVDDLADIAADIACGRIATSPDPERGPVPQRCTPVNVAAGPATARDYFQAVGNAIGVDPIWDEDSAWIGRIVADRARRWGWAPKVDLDHALAEIDQGLRS